MGHDTLHWINAVLHNDESSSDDELIAYFIGNGVTEEDAKMAVSQRDACLLDMHYEVRL